MNSPTFEGKRVVVTGARGVIGRVVVARLTAAGARVVALDRPEVDILRDDLTPHFADASACIHLAGYKSARVEAADLPACYSNVTGTLAVAEVCRRSGTRRLVLASTSHVYAPSEALLAEESPIGPRSAYAASKLGAEAVLIGYAISAGLECAIARLSNVYGGVPDPETIVGRAVIQARDGVPIALRTHDAIRDFIHVDDAAAALVALVTCPVSQAEAFNVGGVAPFSTGDVARVLAGLTGVSIATPDAREAAGAGRFVLSSARLEARTGFRAFISLEDGLARALAVARDTRSSS